MSHERLLHNLRIRRVPEQVCQLIESLLEWRTTSAALEAYKSYQISINTGMPQGSSLSTILFLFFVSRLQPTLQTHSTKAVGFLNDTYILRWSKFTEENYKKLEELYDICVDWPKNHGVRFAPEKFQLMHLIPAGKKHNFQAAIFI